MGGRLHYNSISILSGTTGNERNENDPAVHGQTKAKGEGDGVRFVGS